jgi:hypothetical protein
MKRVVLFTLLGVLLIGCAVNNRPGQVDRAAASIADLDLPAGYRADFSATVAGYTIAAFNPGDDHSHLYLIQSQDEADGEKLAEMLAELAPGTSDTETRTTIVETRAVRVRDQDTTLVISEGENSEGDAYRQALVAFQGKGGPALLVFSEPVTRWSPSTVDALLASIR